MRLPFLRPREPAPGRPRPAPASDEPAAIALARRRARQRLLGALVLLVIGVLVFPLLFETQPRPLPLDTPVVLQRGEPPAAQPAPQRAARSPVPTLPPADAGIEAGPAAASAPETAVAAVAPPARPALAPTRAASAATPAIARAASAAASAPRSGRFVVQVGAFTDANMLREARQRVEKLGLKTYTQVIESDAGKRTRVRVGPFDTRADADAVAAQLKRAKLGANVLAL